LLRTAGRSGKTAACLDRDGGILFRWRATPGRAMSRETVVTTGASAGIGRVTARAFAKRGARLVSWRVVLTGSTRLQWRSKRQGGDALVLPTDVADPHAAAAVERELGPIDIWISNAMVTVSPNSKR
jgi:NAD(P)-dependent dehydrogenase (short-subunit alcohol dehydrogenase family)